MRDPQDCPCSQCKNHDHEKLWCKLFECEIDDSEPCKGFVLELEPKEKVCFT